MNSTLNIKHDDKITSAYLSTPCCGRWLLAVAAPVKSRVISYETPAHWSRFSPGTFVLSPLLHDPLLAPLEACDIREHAKHFIATTILKLTHL
jgi:hypothetical protein